MLAYRAALFGLRLLSPVLSLGESKLARGIAGRRHAHELLVAWGSTLRDPDRPCVWVHAPSVGEGLQADAVIRALRALESQVQIVFTFFSPSAEAWVRSFEVEIATYLPWDLVGPMDAVLDALRPDLVVFTKTELWPVLARLCDERDVPTAIIGASVPPDAGRRKKGARALLGPAWARIAVAGAIGVRDAEGLRTLGVSDDRVVVTGDPGIDAAVSRFEDGILDPQVELLRSDRPTWIAGSTWPSDENVLLPAFERVRRRITDARLLVVPHEPSPNRAAEVLAGAKARGWSIGLLSEVATSGVGEDADVLVVDRVGLLATLYGVADIAYVGGGFRETGVHSVLEPAVAQCPAVFGPNHVNSTVANELLAEDGAKFASNVSELGDLVTSWFEDDALRARIARCARQYVDAHRGAAETTAGLLHDLIRSHR